MLFDVTWQSELYGLWMFMVDISIRSSNVSDNQHLPSNILPHRHFIIHRSDDIYFPIWFYISNVYVVVHQIIHMVDISNVYGVCVYIFNYIYTSIRYIPVGLFDVHCVLTQRIFPQALFTASRQSTAGAAASSTWCKGHHQFSVQEKGDLKGDITN